MNISMYLYYIFHSASLFMMAVRPSFNEEIKYSKWLKILMWLEFSKKRSFIPFTKFFRAVIRLLLFIDGMQPVICFNRDCSPCISALVTTELFSQFETNLMVYGLKYIFNRSFWTGQNQRERWLRPCLS